MEKKELKQITTKVYEEYGFVKKGNYYYLDLNDILICSGFSSRYGILYLVYNISLKAIHLKSEIKENDIFSGFDSGENIMFFDKDNYKINYNEYTIDLYVEILNSVLHKYFDQYKIDAINYLRTMGNILDNKARIPLKLKAKEYLKDFK